VCYKQHLVLQDKFEVNQIYTTMQPIPSKTPRSITAAYLRLPPCVWLDEIDVVIKKLHQSAIPVKIGYDCITWFMTTRGGSLYFTSDKRFDIITADKDNEFTIIHAESVFRHALPSDKGEWFALRFKAGTTVYVDCSNSGIELIVEPEVETPQA
jgi:hypothetical protein